MMQHRHAPIFEDFIVIMQKLTSKDPVGVKNLMSSKLVEILNSDMVKKGQNEFVVQNIKSILRNINSD